MSKYLSLFSAFAFSLVTALTPTIQNQLAHHPTITAITGSVIAVIMHWLPSPAGKP